MFFSKLIDIHVVSCNIQPESAQRLNIELNFPKITYCAAVKYKINEMLVNQMEAALIERFPTLLPLTIAFNNRSFGLNSDTNDGYEP